MKLEKYFNQKGQIALLITLVILGAILSIGLGLTLVTIKEMRMASNIEESAQALSAANAGIEYAMWEKKVSGSIPVGCFNPGDIEYCLEEDIVNGLIISKGIKNNIKRAIAGNIFNWKIEIIDSGLDCGQISVPSYTTSIILDNTDSPHIIYNSKPDVKYAEKISSGWNKEIISDSSFPGYVSIDIDSSDLINVTFIREVIAGCKIVHSKRIGLSNWQDQVSLSAGGGRPDCADLVLDSNDVAHISHNFSIFSNRYTSQDMSNNWFTETVYSVGHGGGRNSIALDSNETPYIAFQDYIDLFDTDTGRIKFATRIGDDNWSFWPDIDSGGSFLFSLAIDSNDIPHICYTRQVAGDILKHAVWNPGTSSWDIETVDTDVDSGFNCSIFLDNGIPHISYIKYNSPNDPDLKYAVWNPVDSSWHIEIVDSDPPCKNVHTSIAVDSNHIPHISYIGYMCLESSARYAVRSPGIVFKEIKP